MHVDGAGYCDSCDKYVDRNPWDPYWEHMNNEFGESGEYKELENAGLVEHTDPYDKAYEIYQKNYEKWPDMRRRMVKEGKKQLFFYWGAGAEEDHIKAPLAQTEANKLEQNGNIMRSKKLRRREF